MKKAESKVLEKNLKILKLLERYFTLNKDLRFVQALINLNITNNKAGDYFIESEESLNKINKVFRPLILDEIADYIGNFCSKYGRIFVSQTKEKYGTVRVYSSFGFLGLHTIIFPLNLYKNSKIPQFLWNLDLLYISRLNILFDWFFVPYQIFIYRMAYKKVIKKYPELTKNILSGADYPEFLEGIVK